MSKISKADFNKKIFDNIYKIIQEYKLIEEGDKIAIALSGGKDSVLTLHALANYQETLDFELIAVSIDEGIEGYRNYGIESARSNAQKLNIPLIEKSFKEEYDFKLDDIYSNFKSACIPCGVFRRNILNKTSYELKVDKLATGHNLDDEIQSFLMSFARSDTLKFSKFGPKLDIIHPKLIPRIKPLWNTLEKDVGTWAILNEIDIHLEECPYSYLSLRAKIKEFLNKSEDEFPNTKKNIMESFKKDLKINLKNPPKLKNCEKCGEPTSSTICKVCEMLETI